MHENAEIISQIRVHFANFVQKVKETDNLIFLSHE
jgi:hypothetical protein